MNKVTQSRVLLLALPFLVMGCDEGDLKKHDGGSVAGDLTTDVGTPDQATSDQAMPDQAMPDKAAPDKATADMGKPDKATPDKGMTDVSTADSTPLPCKCALQNDCCHCKARKAGTTQPVCPTTTCKQPTCGGLLIKQPLLYCKGGHCLLTDGATKCSSDSDCRLVNNCCDCLALPLKALDPPCAITSCFVPTCQGMGMPTAKARCLGGLCKL